MCNQCKKDHKNTESCTIPQADYYVVSLDPAMSNWGGSAGKNNWCVVPCESYSIAQGVVSYVRSRGDQKRINIVENKPRASATRLLSLTPTWLARAVEHNFVSADEISESVREELGIEL